MRKIKIVADSSADIMSLERADFASSPMKIITAERSFIDDSELNVSEMVEFMSHYSGKSQTSCPNVEDWIEAFSGADDIICVTITSALSGSYNSACVAKELFESENEGKRVFVLDSLSAGPEISLIIKKLEDYVESGMTFEEICEKITEYKKSTGLIFMLKSLKNLANNGRVSPIVAKICGIAGICIVGKASDEGTLAPDHKCRGEVRSLETMLCDLEKLGFRKGRISIGHCENESAAERFKEMIKSKFEQAKIEIHKLGGLCSFYAEKGGMLVGFERA